MSTRRRPRRSAAQQQQEQATEADIPVDPALSALVDSLRGDPHSSSDDDDFPGEDEYATQDDDDEDDYRTTSKRAGGQQSQSQQQQLQQDGQVQSSKSLGGRTAATALAPEGMRFCSGCRKNQNEVDFESNRKMCFRHRGKKKRVPGAAPVVSHPDPSSIEVLERTLRAASEADGVSKYEAAVMLDQLPGQEHVELELRLPYTVVGEERAAPKMDTAESMRQARAKARPLVELIHQATGYSFVYKDCRTGIKHKYAFSLRYLCSQRSDQDGTKRRSAALAAERKAAHAAEARRIAEGGAPLDTNAEAGPSNEVQQQQQERQQVEDADVQALQALIAEANQQPHHLQHGAGGEIFVDPMLGGGGGGISVGGGSEQGDLEVDFEVPSGQEDEVGGGGRSRRGRKNKNKGKSVALPPISLPRDSPSASGSPAPQTPASVSASLPANDNASESTSKEKTIRKMERFPCRGSLIINILRDDVTAYFTINHHLHHAHYVDVVGNRLRGAKFHPLPVNLSATVEEPKGDIEMGEEGDTWLEKAETTFAGLLELVRDLKTKKGGGEEEAGQVLYERSEGVRGYRVSVLEALAKGGMGIPRPMPEGKAKKAAAAAAKGPGKGKGKKRAVEAVEDVEDEGASREAPGPSISTSDANSNAAAELAASAAGLHHLPVDLNVDVGDGEGTMRELRMEDMVQGLDVGTLSQLGNLSSLDDHHHHHHHHLTANGLRHQLDGENGDLTVDYSALQAHGFGGSGEAESWMDPRLG